MNRNNNNKYHNKNKSNSSSNDEIHVVGCNDGITAEEQALLNEIERSTDQLNKQVECVVYTT